MGRMSKKDKSVLVPTHELIITVNGAKDGTSWKVTEAGGKTILDNKEKALLEAMRQVTRPTKTRLETTTGYGKKVYELLPLKGQ